MDVSAPAPTSRGNSIRAEPASLAQRYERVRTTTEAICEPLETEDYVIQSMTDVSPIRWHIAHTTWFFETFVLAEHVPEYRLHDATFPFLFNSYYVQAGERWARPDRGLLSRPTVEEIFAYRRYVDEHMARFLSGFDPDRYPDLATVVEIGLNHEQQHQELMVYDIKHNFFINPLSPAYHEGEVPRSADPGAMTWSAFEEGIRHVGAKGTAFHYDNEVPRHRVFLEPFRFANRLVTNREYLEFVESGAYQDPVRWLSEGWACIEDEAWSHPLYWIPDGDDWYEFSLFGRIPLDPNAPVAHISYFEADAYARWKGCRLPTEFEWESTAAGHAMDGHFSDSFRFHARGPVEQPEEGPTSLFGTLWEWTASHYSPYPGYRAAPGALGEYNGKFMCNQFVLRGGSCATSSDHIRATYRNFFPAYARWMMSGIRLAESV